MLKTEEQIEKFWKAIRRVEDDIEIHKKKWMFFIRQDLEYKILFIF